MLLPWQLGALLEGLRERMVRDHEMAYGAAWYGAIVGRARKPPTYEEAMRPFRGEAPAKTVGGRVEDDDAVQRELERMVARADAQKKPKPKGAT